MKYPVPEFGQAVITKINCDTDGLVAKVENSSSNPGDKAINVTNCRKSAQLFTLIINGKYTLGTEFGPLNDLRPLDSNSLGYVLINNSVTAIAIKLEPGEAFYLPFSGDLKTVEVVPLVIPERFADKKTPVLWFWNWASYEDYAESTGTRPTPPPNPYRLNLVKAFTSQDVPQANPSVIITPNSLFTFLISDDLLLNLIIDKAFEVLKNRLGFGV